MDWSFYNMPKYLKILSYSALCATAFSLVVIKFGPQSGLEALGVHYSHTLPCCIILLLVPFTLCIGIKKECPLDCYSCCSTSHLFML